MNKKGLAFLAVSGSFDPKHINITTITAKRFKTSYSNSIWFEDLSGLTFSWSIEKPFSTKNILEFAKSKFQNVKIL